jgi:hypothetical protein
MVGTRRLACARQAACVWACACCCHVAGLEIMVSQSYSKNLGLYGERVGALVMVLNDKQVRRTWVTYGCGVRNRNPVRGAPRACLDTRRAAPAGPRT